jgi:hypothetical protein
MFKGPYSFGSRFEDRAGTNPEELLGAAHAGCFAVALSLVLGEAGFTPESAGAIAHVTVKPQEAASKSLRAASFARPAYRASIRMSSCSVPRRPRRVVLYRRPSQAPRSRSKPGS